METKTQQKLGKEFERGKEGFQGLKRGGNKREGNRGRCFGGKIEAKIWGNFIEIETVEKIKLAFGEFGLYC